MKIDPSSCDFTPPVFLGTPPPSTIADKVFKKARSLNETWDWNNLQEDAPAAADNLPGYGVSDTESESEDEGSDVKTERR